MSALDSERLRLPHWHELRDLVLLTLHDERQPMRRFDLVERIATSRHWPRQLRDQPPLATNPTHSTHIGERLDATVGRMHADGLLDRPNRGYYALSTSGRREARKLAAARPRSSRVTKPRSAAPPAGRVIVGAAAGPLPGWAAEVRAGRWLPYAPIVATTTTAPAPFTWDAEDKDSQTQAHHDVLNRLHAVLRAAGVDVAYSTTRPACDLAFRSGRMFTLVEAKSLPQGSDEHQMRLGLGQAIQYRAELAEHVPGRIRAIIAVPRAPVRDQMWRRACESAGVTLLVVGPATRGLRKALLG